MATSDTPIDDSQTAVAAALNGFLSRLGIKNHDTRDQLDSFIHESLTAVHLTAEVTRIRFGELTLTATPQNAALLRYHVDPLLDALAEKFPGEITAIKIRSQR